MASSAIIASGISSAAGTAILDFGLTPGSNYAEVTVTGQNSISTNSLIDAWLMADVTADHNELEHAIAPITVRCGNITAGTSFVIYATSTHRLTGRFAVRWVRTS